MPPISLKKIAIILLAVIALSRLGLPLMSSSPTPWSHSSTVQSEAVLSLRWQYSCCCMSRPSGFYTIETDDERR